MPTAAEIRAKAKISNTPSLRTDVIASNEGPDEGKNVTISPKGITARLDSPKENGMQGFREGGFLGYTDFRSSNLR